VAFVNGEQVPMAVVGGFVEVKSRRLEGSGPRPNASGKMMNILQKSRCWPIFAEPISELTDVAIEKQRPARKN